MADQRINILTWHAIGDGAGPTNISPATFHAQLQTLKDCGYTAVSLTDFAAWHAGEITLAPRSVVLTFDDGLASFAQHAFPALAGHAFTATVFLPVAHMGGQETWQGARTAPRRLMSWAQVAELAKTGIDFGSHSCTHRDLRRLNAEELRRELKESRDQIAQRLQTVPVSFAPPYGYTNPHVRDAISEWYRLSAGTRLQRADRQCDVMDLPRIDMHYFRDPRRWRAYLEGRGEGYFLIRRTLRAIRAIASGS